MKTTEELQKLVEELIEKIDAIMLRMRNKYLEKS
jgi:hypothetical protein